MSQASSWGSRETPSGIGGGPKTDASHHSDTDLSSSPSSSQPSTSNVEYAVRSPSPREHNNTLGIGVSPSSGHTTPFPSSSVLATYPHLAHYLFNLLQNVQFSPPRTTSSQHPLSLSSSGESDGSDEDDLGATSAEHGEADQTSEGVEQKTPKKGRVARSSGGGGVTGIERDELVRNIVQLLDNEEEEEVKNVLKPHMGDLGKDDILMDQVCLDCMHRRRDDREHVPYAPHLTPTRARGSPIPSALPLRPYTPTRVPSFRNRTPIGRPQSPSPALQASVINHSSSHSTSANLSAGPAAPSSSSGYSSSGSPIASPRLLNAKAATFSPTPRVVSAPISYGNSSFLPSDPWRDAPAEPPRSASPFGAIGPTSMNRTGSNLAIAAPLFSAHSSPFHSPVGTPNRVPIKMPDVFASPASSVNRPSTKSFIPDDDDDDEFSPFGKGLPRLHHHDNVSLNSEARSFTPFSPSVHAGGDSYFGDAVSGQTEGTADEMSNEAGAGMTPLDVLCSVFTSVPRPELEDALHRSGYDFESAMGLLVAQHTLPRSGSSTPQRVSSPRPLLGVGNRGGIQVNHHAPREGYFQQGGRSLRGDMSPGFGSARSPGGQGGKMCRYFLAGECRRSDCRFSHDIDRALCRFWLRGHCAKGPNCEFLHQLPTNFDASALSNAMSHVEISQDGYARPSSPVVYTPQDEFPDLLSARLGRGARFDPSRNRFANAVKRATPTPLNMIQISGARQGPPPSSTQSSYSPGLEPRSLAPAPAVVAIPRPSQRIKLRPPTLLPTLKTGASVNSQYMNTRATAVRLGHARNACLARAADAFRRGDGAAAKRFSREGKALNQRMLNEASEAAQSLVKERREEAQAAIREREASWSDDPLDRKERGKECAGGLGVIMGVAGKRNVPGGDRVSAEERTECLLDLHTLHGSEGADIAAQFLAELERENFRGLAYVVVGEEKHVGTQDPLRGASKVRLASSVKQCLAEWGYAWNETAGVICVDPCRS
ncbi:hypothetical protein IAR55_006740 [Kwoniella newhampshirensis]|uniref:C3H1-type domain-containing protein n=1 Tax=Kwoniella newhampshirensis TaxID=1651941 RepID=A0AAW0YI22_9TREE